MSNEKTPAPERIYIGQWPDGAMHYQWTADRSDLAEWEHGMPDAPEIDEGPRGTVVEYVRADLAEP